MYGLTSEVVAAWFREVEKSEMHKQMHRNTVQREEQLVTSSEGCLCRAASCRITVLEQLDKQTDTSVQPFQPLLLLLLLLLLLVSVMVNAHLAIYTPHQCDPLLCCCGTLLLLLLCCRYQLLSVCGKAGDSAGMSSDKLLLPTEDVKVLHHTPRCAQQQLRVCEGNSSDTTTLQQQDRQ